MNKFLFTIPHVFDYFLEDPFAVDCDVSLSHFGILGPNLRDSVHLRVSHTTGIGLVGVLLAWRRSHLCPAPCPIPYSRVRRNPLLTRRCRQGTFPFFLIKYTYATASTSSVRPVGRVSRRRTGFGRDCALIAGFLPDVWALRSPLSTGFLLSLESGSHFVRMLHKVNEQQIIAGLTSQGERVQDGLSFRASKICFVTPGSADPVTIRGSWAAASAHKDSDATPSAPGGVQGLDEIALS